MEWLAPPERGVWGDFVHELNERPGEWAVAEQCKTERRATTVRSHLQRYHGLDAKVRKGNGGWTVYARVGPSE